MRAVLRRPDFRLLLSGLFFSMTAEMILILALAIWVKDLTGSDGLAGAAILSVVAPMFLAPLLGYVVDRFRRRPFLVTVLAVSALVLSPLLLVHERSDLWIIYAVGVCYGLSNISVSAALNGLIKEVIPDELLADANGALQTVKQGLRLVAPLIGAGLYAATKGWGLAVVGMCGFVIAALLISMLRVREEKPQPSEMHWVTEVSAGVRHLVSVPALRRTLIGVGVVILMFGLSESVFFAFVDQGLHRPPTFVALVVTAQGLGALPGGLTAALVIRKLGEIGTASLGIALFLPITVTSLWPNEWLVLPTAVLAGAGLPYLIVAINTLMQRSTPQAILGRTSAALEAMFSGPQALFIAFGAVLVELVPFRALFGVMALAGTAGLLYMWRGRALTMPSADLGAPVVQPVLDQPVGDGGAVGQAEAVR